MAQKPSVRLQQLVFAFYMSCLMSLMMSGVLTALNTGLAGPFVQRWLAGWVVAWAVAFPLVLCVAPLARRLTEATTRWLERFGPGGAG